MPILERIAVNVVHELVGASIEDEAMYIGAGQRLWGDKTRNAKEPRKALYRAVYRSEFRGKNLLSLQIIAYSRAEMDSSSRK